MTADTYRKMYESFLQAYTSSVSRQSYPVADARVITPASRPHVRKPSAAQAGSDVRGAFWSHGRHRNCLPSPHAGPYRPVAQTDPRRIRPSVHRELPPTGKFFPAEVAKRPQSGFSEGLRRAMRAINLADTSRPVRILGITSALPGDGKSTCASNLAMHYSMKGSKTLLVDADIVHSALTTRLRPETVQHPATADIGDHISPSANGGFDISAEHCLDSQEAVVGKRHGGRPFPAPAVLRHGRC